ncbi:hypothetical protein [Rhodococcus erythropolis]|uniref:hypothetical protein n=1 Tax=Rhodococcus erythropolis TaxID=1833 RepID=UPI001BE8896B|nr:hypothetical protein [Rhodococcus erythropolis]MBT2268772.1 hypothetical protein [Rhodococcus erythropolis]
MRFPAPDVGVARFPGVDEASVAFPPAPKLVVRVSTETVIDIISTGVVIGVPWHLAQTVIDVTSTATVTASVTVDTESVVEVVSQTVQIIDIVNSETIVDIISGTTVKPSPTINTNTVVDIAPTSTVTPSPTINTETVIDIASTAVIVPSPTTAGETIVDIASTSTVKPSPTVNTNTVVDILSEGVISTFKPSGMTKNASTQAFSGATAVQVTGMAAEAGSTLSGSALLPNGTKAGASVACQAYCTGIGYGNTLTVQVRKDGVLIPGASITTPNIYVSTYTVIVPTVTTDVVATDQISIWVNASSSGSATIAAGTGTFVRIT